MDKSNLFTSATNLANQIFTGEITSTQLTNDFYNRIKEHNDTLKAIVISNRKEALESARKLDIACNIIS